MDNKPANANNGLAVAALVCGIGSIVFSWWGLVSAAGIVLGVLAIIFAVKAKKTADPNKRGMITGGLVCGIIGLVLSVIFFACAACVCATGSAVESAINNSDYNWTIE